MRWLNNENDVDGETPMTEAHFRQKKPNIAKLLAYGFERQGNAFCFRCALADGLMQLTVCVEPQGDVTARVIDCAAEEEYILHRVPEATGTFVGQIRAEYDARLSEIADRCFDPEVFKGDQTGRVIAYCRQTYGSEFEYLWQDSPDAAIVRRADNRKWYAVLMLVSRRKLGLCSDENAEVLNLHADSGEVPTLVARPGIFPAYHMNKKHWVTVCLDGTVPDEVLFSLVDRSYALGKKQKRPAGKGAGSISK